MDTILHDVRYAARKFLKSPGFTAAAVITLALGIGANSAIFSVVNGVLLRPLPFREPDRVMKLAPYAQGQQLSFSPPNFRDVRRETHAFSDVVAYNNHSANMSLEGAEPERIRAAEVTATFFTMLGVPAQRGRTFLRDEDQRRAAKVVVLSDELWRRRFGGDPSVIGRTITIDDEPRTVVGVAPAGFTYPGRSELWQPLVFGPEFDGDKNRGAQFLGVIARLAPGATIDRAQNDLATVMRRLEQAYPQSNTGLTAQVKPLQSWIVGDVRPKLLVLLGAVGLVLLIACANVANLMLARASARESEIAVRTALGAARARLVRQLLTESVLLALAGTVVGLLVASWAVDLLVRFGPQDIPRLSEVRLDGAMVLLTVLLGAATGVVFGLIPALHATSPDINTTLREGGRGVRSSPGRRRARSSLVVSEVAVALMLLAGAGLLIRSFAKLLDQDPGFRADGVLTFQLSLPDAKYDSSATQRAFVRALEPRLEQLPGVRIAAVSTFLPLSGSDFNISFTIEGRPQPKPGEEPGAEIRPITPDYFAAMGIPLAAGRTFTAQDRAGAPQVAIINRALAKRYFPGENPIGKHVTLGWSDYGVHAGGEIVGIVGDVRQFGLDHDASPEIYLPFDQRPYPALGVVLRTTGDPAALAGVARNAVHEVDASLPLYEVRTLRQAVSESVAQPRFYTMLLVVFATVALVLAAIGIYGVISYGVVQRTHEIGVRMALGARPGDVLRLVVGQGIALTIVGLAIGVVLALLLTRVLASLLFGVSRVDPLTFGAVSLVLLAVALLASWLPARRAARVDPSRTLGIE